LEKKFYPGKGKEIVEDSNPEEEHEGTKREDVIITFIQHVDEIAQGACWTDKEWVLTLADLLDGHAAPLARCIRTGLSVGQPIGSSWD